jgi:uncharacterized RDD family membrane protein YckC
VATPDHHYAGLVSRISALGVDLILIAAAAGAVRVLPEVVWKTVTNLPVPHWLSTAFGLAAALLPFLYFTLCWWLPGQTVGQMLVGIAVRRRNGHEDPSLIQAALRSAFGLALFPLWIVGLLAILWDPKRRAWHDKVFRTVVPYVSRLRKTPQAEMRPR